MNKKQAIDLIKLVAKGSIPKLIVSVKDMVVIKPLMDKARKTALTIYPNGAGEVTLAS